MAGHLTENELQQLLEGELSPAAELSTLAHLAECRACAQLATPRAAAILAEEGEVVLLDFERGADRAYDAAIDRAMSDARAALARREKESKRGEQIRARIQAGRRFLPKDFEGRTLIDELLRVSFAARYESPRRMLELAGLALQIAQRRRPESRGLNALLQEDLHAEVLAEYGNACRVNDLFDAAEGALSEATALWTKGTEDLFLRARILDLRASLLTDRRRFAEAMPLLTEAHEIYSSLGEAHLAGRTLIKQGIHAHDAGTPRVGLRLLEEGLSQIDIALDPKLVITAQQAIVHALVDCGEHKAAAERLLRSGLRQAISDDSLSLVKLRAVEAKIQMGLGHPRAAERAFDEARQGFLAHQQPFLAAVAAVDVMQAQLRQGKTQAVRELAAEAVATFQRLNIHREALMALAVVQDAACGEFSQAQLAFVLERAARFLPRLEREPYLRFAQDA